MFLTIVFNYDVTIFSSIGCKIFMFFNYGLDALSPWCLVYISIEKFIAIAYPAKRFLFKRYRNQIIYLIILILFNIVYRLNVPFGFDLINYDNITFCNFINDEWQRTIAFMDLANCALAPFLLMLIFSILLIVTIFKSRSRVNLNASDSGKKRLKQDVKFAISLITMNLFFLILILPLEIVIFFLPYYNYDLFNILYYVFYISYAINFYVLFITNSLFRKVFLSLFFKMENSSQVQQNKRIAQIIGNNYLNQTS